MKCESCDGIGWHEPLPPAGDHGIDDSARWHQLKRPEGVEGEWLSECGKIFFPLIRLMHSAEFLVPNNLCITCYERYLTDLRMFWEAKERSLG